MQKSKPKSEFKIFLYKSESRLFAVRGYAMDLLTAGGQDGLLAGRVWLPRPLRQRKPKPVYFLSIRTE